jgi:hypothetical protein
MKRNGNITELFRKHEAKVKNIASSTPPVCADVEGQPQKQEPPPPTQNDEEEPPPATQIISAVSVEQFEEEPPPIFYADRIECDPGLRAPIANYDVNEHDAVRRRYILNGSYPPYAYEYPTKKIYGKDRCFSTLWLNSLNIVLRRMQRFA